MHREIFRGCYANRWRIGISPLASQSLATTGCTSRLSERRCYGAHIACGQDSQRLGILPWLKPEMCYSITECTSPRDLVLRTIQRLTLRFRGCSMVSKLNQSSSSAIRPFCVGDARVIRYDQT